MSTQPVSTVEWVPREALTPNGYNPNRQPPPEFRLLKVSILEDGWTQPIVVFEEGGKLVIVDGEHRWMVAADPAVAKLTGGLVPVVRITKDRANRIMSTIRHNRARGEHTIRNMGELIRELLTKGFAVADVCFLLGMEDEEVGRLAETAGLPSVITAKNGEEFSKGWVPG